MERTNRNGTLRLADVGKKVVLLGWIAKTRKLGGLFFADLRDTTGYIQLVSEHPDDLPDVRNEYVVEVRGIVRKKDVPNPNLPTGEVEVLIEKLTVINKAELTPFIIADKTDALEETRLQYRYLDIRRPILQNRLKTRAKIVRLFHEFFDSHDFVEVETPVLNLATPEGARDYLVPSRLHHGRFYALPQSPQIFKQLLMIGGMERYYQIARCFRDEDLRADRQPEFTQVDLETSFLDQDQILSLMEECLAKIFKEVVNYDVKLPLRRLKYWDAMDTYGSDKPDTRFEMKLIDLKEVLAQNSMFRYLLGNGYMSGETPAYIKGIVVKGVAAETSRKKLDELNMEARKFNLRGVICLKREQGALTGSFTKFLDEKTQKALMEGTKMEDGDILLFATSNSRRNIDFGLGALRSKYAKELGLIEPNTYDLLWVVDFPMFDPIPEEPGHYTAEHHPFTRPRDEDLPLLDTKPEEVLAYAYDIIINGYEAGGGTLRIYDHDTQWKIFKILGLSDEDVSRKFGWFIDAFKYGVPPHGGLAFGLDRLCMILTGTDNIRDVEAFPKNLQAVDPTSKAPGEVADEQLDAVGIQIKDYE